MISWQIPRSLRYSFSQGLRVSQYLGQMILANLALGRKPQTKDGAPPTHPKIILEELKKLFEKDLENIEAGLYKEPENFAAGNLIDFAFKSVQTLLDLRKVESRRKTKAVTQFSKEIPMEEFPKYFAQTFHFQTDGYLSDSSAKLYDHQVELVFGGGAEAMRRMALLPIYYHLKSTPYSQTPICLDVACGTGSFLYELARNFPELSLTAFDLSPWYLNRAKARLKQFPNIEFIEGNAEKLPFADHHFDIITNIYLLHELPRRVRKIVLEEIFRVLKPGGIFVLMDSIQRGDKPELDLSLENFPQIYHEPYYLDFIEQNFKKLFEEIGFELESIDLSFFSKIWVLKKS